MNNRFRGFFEARDLQRLVDFDEVDALKLVEKDRMLCLVDMDDFPEQEQHEGSGGFDEEDN